MSQNKEGKTKLESEAEYRRRLLNAARLGGFEADLIRLFARYDDFQKGCTTKEQRNAVAMVAIKELNDLFNLHKGWTFKDALGQDRIMTIDGKIMDDK